MKIMAFGDVHLGTYRFPIREHIMYAMSEIVDIATSEFPDIILFAGDAFRHRVPSAGDVADFGKFLHSLSRTTDTIVMIPGNHDIAGGGSTTIDVYRHYGKVYVIDKPMVYVHGDWNVEIACVPWLPQKSVTQQGGSGNNRDAISALLQLLRPKTADSTKIMLAHATSLGAEFAEGVDTLLGQDVAWPPDWFVGYDLAVLGHIHKPQQIPGAPNAYYTGSICPVSFSEAGQSKFVLMWEDGKVTQVPLYHPAFVQLRDEDLPVSLPIQNTFLQIKKAHGDPDPEDIPECAWYEIVSEPPKNDKRVRLDSESAAAMSPRDAIAQWLALADKGDVAEKVFELIDTLTGAEDD